MEDDKDSEGVRRFPMGACPIIAPETGETIIDSEGRMLETDYMEEKYPMKIAAVGYGALYDPENVKPRS